MATRRGDERDREPRRRPADRIEREETRPSRDDTRTTRDDPRADPRADPRGDPRGAREDVRGPRIPGLGEYFLPGDGIDRQVLQVELCKFLGSEAIARPGEYNGQRGFLIRAVRPFTPAMVRSLKESSREYRSEVRDLRMQDYEVPYQNSGTYRDAETRRRQDPGQMSSNQMILDDPYQYQPSSTRAPVPGGSYSSASEYSSRTAPAPGVLYSSGPGYPSRTGFAPAQAGYPVTSLGGQYNDTDYIPVPGDYPMSGTSHQPQSYMQPGYGYSGPPPSVSSGRGNPNDDPYMYYDPATGQPLSASSAGGHPTTSSTAREPRTMPGYDARSQPGYDPRSSPGYDPRTQAGSAFDTRTQPGYDSRAQPGYDPRTDPRYEDPRSVRASESSARPRPRDEERRRAR